MAWVERLDDLVGLHGDLAPPLVNAAVCEVLGTDAVSEEWPIEAVIRRLSGEAHARARVAAIEGDTDRYGGWSAAKQERLAAIAEGELESIAEELDLAFARLSGRADPEHEEVIMATKTAERRTKSSGRKIVYRDPPPAGICVGCGTAIGSGLAACPACGGTDRRPLAAEPLPSSLGALNGEVVPVRNGAVAGEPAQWRDLAPPSADRAPVAAEERDVPVELIDPSPYQRRRRFDEDALRQLAESIAADGLLQRVLVRPKPDGRYELVAGERRLRAVKLNGSPAIAAAVRDLTDAQAARACARENLDREDLDPIERAETLKVLLEVGGETQEQLAERLGRTQGWVSNQLRLLELPDAWREGVITQKIPPTHARELLRWKHRPNVLERVGKELDQLRATDGRNDPAYVPAVATFQQIVRKAAWDASRSLSERDAGFKVTPKHREQLDVEGVECPYGGRVEQRAFAVAAYNRLRKEARERAKKSGKPAAKSNGHYSYQPPPGPAEWEILRQIRPWLCRQILDRIGRADKDLIARLFYALAPDLGSPVQALLGLRPHSDARSKTWAALAERSGAELGKLQREIVVGCLMSAEKGHHGGQYAHDVGLLGEILRYVGGEPLAYELSAKDLDLYGLDQLRKMPASAAAPEKATKADLVKQILADREPGWLPPEYERLLTPPKPKKSRKAKPR